MAPSFLNTERLFAVITARSTVASACSIETTREPCVVPGYSYDTVCYVSVQCSSLPPLLTFAVEKGEGKNYH